MQPHQKAWQRKEALRRTDGDHGFIICSKLWFERFIKQMIKLLQPSKWLFSHKQYLGVVKTSERFHAVHCGSCHSCGRASILLFRWFNEGKKNTFVVFFMNLFCTFSWAAIDLEVGSTLHRFISLACCLPLVREQFSLLPWTAALKTLSVNSVDGMVTVQRLVRGRKKPNDCWSDEWPGYS